MKTSYARLIKGVVLVTATVAALGACSRTYVERPAAAPSTTIVVPESERSKDVIVVPNP
jgi:hypothetical protein